MYNTIITILHGYRVHVIILFVSILILFGLHYDRSFLISLKNIGILISFTTLWASYYIGNRYLDYFEETINQPDEARRDSSLPIIIITAYFLSLFFLWYAKLPLSPYILLIFVTLFYNIKIFGWRVQSSWFIKNIYAGVSWWFTIAIFIAYYVIPTVSLVEALQNSFLIFLFNIIIELLWDIRDIKGDSLAGNKTIPVTFGESSAKLFVIPYLILGLFYIQFNVHSWIFYNLIYLFLSVIFAKTIFPPAYYHSIIYGQLLFVSFGILLLTI